MIELVDIRPTYIIVIEQNVKPVTLQTKMELRKSTPQPKTAIFIWLKGRHENVVTFS